MSETDYSKIKILIADDVKLNIVLTQKALSVRPYTIFTASNGEEALQIIQEQHPDILLLDIMMPGIDGFEVIKRIRAGEAGNPNIRIVILSALNSTDDIKQGHETGADDFVTKPILIPHLLEVVNAQVEAVLNK